MTATNSIDQYHAAVTQLLDRVFEEQRNQMGLVATLWAQAIIEDKLAYVFGSGHSRYIAGELYWRAGGLAPVMLIDDPTAGMAERVEGYAAEFMKGYDLQQGDLLFVVSNSGINPVPIEVATLGKQAGATVIAVTNLTHSERAQSRVSSGQKLYQIADHVLDTMGIYGDAAVALPGVDWRVAPVSTLISVAMLNAIVAQTAENLLAEGIKPPVLVSANVPEGDSLNQTLSDRYWRRLARFPRKRASG